MEIGFGFDRFISILWHKWVVGTNHAWPVSHKTKPLRGKIQIKEIKAKQFSKEITNS